MLEAHNLLRKEKERSKKRQRRDEISTKFGGRPKRPETSATTRNYIFSDEE
jgi:hypothetical protein